MKSEPFLTPSLIGTRFDGGVIPLSVLGDLAVLEEMIVEVAKWKYLEANRDRKRVPRRFTEGMTLKLTDIEEGSARPIIQLFVAVSTLLPTPARQFFDEARSAIVGAIGAAEQGQNITDFLPQKLLGYFDRFGRNLEEGEAIEFIEGTSTPVRLTKETRRILVLASAADKVTDEIVVHGLVPEMDQLTNTFQFQLVNGTKVKAPLARQHFDTVLETFNNYKHGMKARMYATGLFNRADRLESVESVEHISILDPLDVAARIDELSLLKDGWLDGYGLAPSNSGLKWLVEVFNLRFPDDLPLPYLYPTVKGGVRAEWSAQPHELSLDIDLAVRAGNWHYLNLNDDDELSRTLSLDVATDWDWLLGEVRRLMGVNA